MQVAFRTDASLAIGTGHVMRCLTLAEALRERGATCKFICRIHPGNLIAFIQQRGFEVLALHGEGKKGVADGENPSHAGWLGVEWATDAEQTKAGTYKAPFDWLIVDHYALDARWERALRAVCRKLMAIDDLADRPHECDFLLDQNLGRCPECYVRLVPDGCSIFTGPMYALLRPEFSAVRPYSLARRAKARLQNVLIAMGGVDKENATSQVLAAVHGCTLPADVRIRVVMGPYAPWTEQVREIAAAMPWSTEVFVNTRDMAKLMAESDLAIGAVGVSAWERCCLGLPTLAAVLASNQREGAAALRAAGCVEILGDRAGGFPDLPEKLAGLLAPGRLATMQRACAALTDGMGASRITSEIMYA